jgi:hypothetical protein
MTGATAMTAQARRGPKQRTKSILIGMRATEHRKPVGVAA